MIAETLKKTILEVLGLEDHPIDETTTAADVPGWDSLSHVKILAAAEKAFDIRFRSLEVIRIRNVGELQALIDRKRSQ
jgi:acyl carrier protein